MQLLIKYLNMAFYMKASLDLLNIAEEIFLKPNEDLFVKKSKSFNPETGPGWETKALHRLSYITCTFSDV